MVGKIVGKFVGKIVGQFIGKFVGKLGPQLGHELVLVSDPLTESRGRNFVRMFGKGVGGAGGDYQIELKAAAAPPGGLGGPAVRVVR